MSPRPGDIVIRNNSPERGALCSRKIVLDVGTNLPHYPTVVGTLTHLNPILMINTTGIGGLNTGIAEPTMW